jgi:hypothetical protein
VHHICKLSRADPSLSSGNKLTQISVISGQATYYSGRNALLFKRSVYVFAFLIIHRIISFNSVLFIINSQKIPTKSNGFEGFFSRFFQHMGFSTATQPFDLSTVSTYLSTETIILQGFSKGIFGIFIHICRILGSKSSLFHICGKTVWKSQLTQDLTNKNKHSHFKSHRMLTH